MVVLDDLHLTLQTGAGDVNILRGFTMTVGRGETVAVVGPSGSGKSTVARCIMRLVEPTAGEVLLHGEHIAHLSTRALRPHRRRLQQYLGHALAILGWQTNNVTFRHHPRHILAPVPPLNNANNVKKVAHIF